MPLHFLVIPHNKHIVDGDSRVKVVEMTKNVHKYLLMLESLEFADPNDPPNVNSARPHAERLQRNMTTLRRYVKLRKGPILKRLALDTAVVGKYLDGSVIDQENVEVLYAGYMGHVLLTIVTQTKFNSDAKEDLISVKHTNLCIAAAQDLSIFALRYQMHESFVRSALFCCPCAVGDTPPHYGLLRISIEIFARILQTKQFHAADAMEEVLRDYMAGIFTLFYANAAKEVVVETADVNVLRGRLEDVWTDIGKVAYFRNIMLLKSVPNLPTEIQRLLHSELLAKVERNEGFTTLVGTLYAAHLVKSELECEKPMFEVIASIVGHRGHSKRFQRSMIEQIFKFIDRCHTNAPLMETMGAGLLSLRRLYDVDVANREQIRQQLRLSWEQLTTPMDLIAGLIVMSHQEICTMVATMFQLFCTSGVECLPSELLIDYLPLLMHMYSQLPAKIGQRPQLSSLVARCLHNRTTKELENIIFRLFTGLYEASWLYLHDRLVFVHNKEHPHDMSVKVNPVTDKDRREQFSVALALPMLLIDENVDLLIYQVFVTLLRLMGKLVLREDGDEEAAAIDLLQTEEELVSFLTNRFPVKVEILISLSNFVMHEPLKQQLVENSHEFVQVLGELIDVRLGHANADQAGASDETLCMMLSLLQEVLEHTHAIKPGGGLLANDLMPLMAKLRALTPDQTVHKCITKLSTLMIGGENPGGVNGGLDNEFKSARADMESPQPHMRVSGIQQMIALIKSDSSVAITNEPIIVALVLNVLKDRDSYAFLNCVRLIVALVNVLEQSTLELLVDEYLSDAEKNIDYRLVVGEALIAVGKELGELCYKYREVLLDCFLNAARSVHNDLRMSGYANLGQFCRILTYQVNSFFHEMLLVIETELATGDFMPAKRAAVMVLAELLDGMDDMMACETMLKPIYRRLKEIDASTTADDQMRVHATNGLKILNTKCRRMLFPEQRLEKPIQVLGVRNTHTGPRPTSGLKFVLELD